MFAVPLALASFDDPTYVCLNEIEVLSCTFRDFPYPEVFWKGGSDFFTIYENEYTITKLYVVNISKSYTCGGNYAGSEQSAMHKFIISLRGKCFFAVDRHKKFKSLTLSEMKK